MTKRGLKKLLRAYRGAQESNDPRLLSALEHVERDPELAKWFANEQAFDAKVGSYFREVPVPEGLRDAILRGSKIVTLESAPRQFLARAIAASFVVFAGLT